MCMEIASTGKVMAIGDADGGVHLLSSEDGATFAQVPVMPEFADEAFEETPLNIENMNDSLSFIPYEYVRVCACLCTSLCPRAGCSVRT